MIVCPDFNALFLNADIRLSIQRIIKQTGVAEADLDKEVDNDLLRKVYPLIDDWELLAHELQLEDSQINRIKYDSTLSMEMKGFDALKKWHRKNSFLVKYYHLLETFIKLGNLKAAEKICKLLGM